jgi:hypothetical protein
MKVPFLGGAYEGRSPNVSPQTCINWFYEKGKDGESLVGTPGATLFVDLGSGEVRGAIEYNGNAWFVMGSTLYEVNSAGTATSRGTLNTSSGRVSMAHNGVRTGASQEIFIADGNRRYLYDNTTSTLTAYTDYAATTVTFLDGYFIFTITDSDRIYYTDLYDGTTVTVTNFFTLEGNPDEAVSIISDQRELFGFGDKTLEVWYNSGDTDNTFQRFQGGFKQMGCVAPFTAQKLDNGIAWLTKNERGDAMVATLGEGYAPRFISTPEVSYQLSKYSTVSDAFAYTYQDEGHEFYVLTFPTEQRTWVYDVSTQEWHQRAHTINGTFPHRERYNCHVFAFGKHLMGDFSNGKIYQLDSTVGKIESTRIPRERTSPDVTNEEKRVRISEFHLDMEEGTGDPNDATDTTIWLSYSKDGGHTWSNEVSRSIGDAGDYRRRIIWRRLGWGRHWIFKVRTWSPNAVILKGAYTRIYGEPQ